MLRDEPAVGRGLFDGVQLLALDVLHEGDLEHLMIGDFPHEHGDLIEPGSLRRPPPPLPSDELESRPVFTDDERLYDALLAHGLGEIAEPLFVDMLTRLVGVGVDPRRIDVEQDAAADPFAPLTLSWLFG